MKHVKVDRILEYHNEHLYIQYLDLKIINIFSFQFIYFFFFAEYFNILSGYREVASEDINILILQSRKPRFHEVKDLL